MCRYSCLPLLFSAGERQAGDSVAWIYFRTLVCPVSAGVNRVGKVLERGGPPTPDPCLKTKHFSTQKLEGRSLEVVCSEARSVGPRWTGLFRTSSYPCEHPSAVWFEKWAKWASEQTRWYRVSPHKRRRPRKNRKNRKENAATDTFLPPRFRRHAALSSGEAEQTAPEDETLSPFPARALWLPRFAKRHSLFGHRQYTKQKKRS